MKEYLIFSRFSHILLLLLSNLLNESGILNTLYIITKHFTFPYCDGRYQLSLYIHQYQYSSGGFVDLAGSQPYMLGYTRSCLGYLYTAHLDYSC
jgi:hypothetical protein